MQHNVIVNGQRQEELREAVKQFIRWAWRRNGNLEEQAAQLHMLVGWTQLVEVSTGYFPDGSKRTVAFYASSALTSLV